MDSKKIRWGILGPGRISQKFASDLLKVNDAELTGVGSRKLQRARAFKEEFGATYAFGSYRELVECPEIDVIYVASPHTGHMEHSIMCLENNKAVLCEKPLAVNSGQITRMIETARDKGVFLMEAIWTRFLPYMKDVKDLCRDGTLGPLRVIEADFGFNSLKDPKGRLYDPHLAGGALLDVGIYPVFLTQLLLGKPDQIKASAQMQGGIDLLTTIQLSWDSGQFANLHCAINTNTDTSARIYGEDQYLVIPKRWHEAKSLALYNDTEKVWTKEYPDNYKGYAYEIMEVQRCLRNNQLESELLPLQFSLELMQTLDTIRDEISLKYPFE